MDPRGSPPWFGAKSVRSNFGWSRKFEFWGMVIFYGFDQFFPQCDPHWPQDGLLGIPTVIWRHNRQVKFWPKSMTKIRILGHGDFFCFWPIFWPQWDPIGHKMDPRRSPPWFGAITIRSNFGQNQWPRGSRKFEFCGMVIFYGFVPCFAPNGSPLAPRWTLGGPHRDLAP